jgi:type IV pilus assembly protein PilW
MKIRAPYHQIGLSMVELLVVLAVSSFLILGITQAYIENNRSHAFQISQSGNTENGRFAALTLNEYLSKAGYRRAPSELPETAFSTRAAGDDCLEFKGGAAVTALDPSEGIGFCIRYQPANSGELDCQGIASEPFTETTAFSEVPDSSTIILAIKYLPSETADLHKGSLLCKSLNADTPQYVELIDGVADFRVDFGTGLNPSVETYVSQADWDPATDDEIRSVRYAMLLSSNARLQRDAAHAANGEQGDQYQHDQGDKECSATLFGLESAHRV